MSLDSFEANFDGLVGPTHHYAGLSVGNIASTRNAKQVSHPKKAALQGIAKAAFLRDLGVHQGILPPLRRPRLDTLRALGFSGTDSTVIEKAYRSVPQLLSACYSASSMWVANAATYSPSADTSDGKAHFTPANLSSKFHRSLEPKQTAANLRALFPDAGGRFVHHDPILPQFGDEGAANHSRLTPAHGLPGVEVFVFGGSVLQEASYVKAKKFPARQSIEASHAIATHHGLDFTRTVILQQNPEAIDAGVFHNDVVAVANENVLFLHERAFLDQSAALLLVRAAWKGLKPSAPFSKPLAIVEVTQDEVPLEDAVRSYLFNSQLVTLPSDGASESRMALVCPEECREIDSVRNVIDSILSGTGRFGRTPIAEAHYLDVRESMQNGGGPACLRLRVVLSPAEMAAVNPKIWLTTEREGELRRWVEKHYRDRLSFDDLGDPRLFHEVHAALDDLEALFGCSLA